MADVTYYVALPFSLTEDGELIAGQAKECQSSNSAVREARRLAETSAGAVAFSRTGDPSSGDFQDGIVIETRASASCPVPNYCLLAINLDPSYTDSNRMGHLELASHYLDMLRAGLAQRG
jgi:hypothetical protein